jgi:uncharacterized protein YcfL
MKRILILIAIISLLLTGCYQASNPYQCTRQDLEVIVNNQATILNNEEKINANIKNIIDNQQVMHENLIIINSNIKLIK